MKNIITTLACTAIIMSSCSAKLNYFDRTLAEGLAQVTQVDQETIDKFEEAENSRVDPKSILSHEELIQCAAALLYPHDCIEIAAEPDHEQEEEAARFLLKDFKAKIAFS